MPTLRDYFNEDEINNIIRRASDAQKDIALPVGVRESCLNLEISARELYISALRAFTHQIRG